MTELSPLISFLLTSLDWNRARITVLAQFMVAVIRVRTVNLHEIATAFCGDANVASHDRRIQRFLKDFTFSRAQMTALVTRLLPLGEQWLLCLDRTNWQFGTMNINILV